MPMTKQRRDQLRSQCGDGSFDDSYGFHGGEGEGLSCSELRELLDGAERLEHVTQWLERYAGSAGSHYADGFASCARMALLEIESPLPQGEPEG